MFAFFCWTFFIQTSFLAFTNKMWIAMVFSSKPSPRIPPWLENPHPSTPIHQIRGLRKSIFRPINVTRQPRNQKKSWKEKGELLWDIITNLLFCQLPDMFDVVHCGFYPYPATRGAAGVSHFLWNKCKITSRLSLSAWFYKAKWLVIRDPFCVFFCSLIQS